MSRLFFLSLLFLLLVACNTDQTPEDGYDGYTLVWSDEFNAAFDATKWAYDIGDGTDYGLPAGWGNAEKQIYTSSSSNSLILGDEDGNSVFSIIAKKEAGTHRYSSAKITTRHLQGFRFGRIQARIKVPVGKGLWPAFWLLGENNTEVDWPGCGEIDIMEVIGHEPSVVHSTVHFTNAENKAESDGGSYDFGSSLGDDYHIYRLDWSPESMQFFMDDVLVHELTPGDDMKEFLRSFYLIFNVAVGGNWPGNPDETTVFPQRMLIDWVRVYEKDGFNPPAAPDLNIEEETIGVISFSLPKFAFNESMNQFPDLLVKSFGDGGEPGITTSDIRVEGDSSLILSYPGNSWGGAFFIVDPVVDASRFANGKLRFSLKIPDEMKDIEIKLESVSTAVSLFLKDYSGVDVGNGFLEYTIPLADFEGLSLADFKIPFALWNPKNESGEYFAGDIWLDNVYFEE